MKQNIERRSPHGIKDFTALALTTFGVGYLPLAPGTWGSMVGVGLYLVVSHCLPRVISSVWAVPVLLTAFILFALAGVWAAGRSTELLGNSDPSQAVVDEVLGQLIVFAFVPFGLSWPFVLAGFLLFRLFDIWKPYPIDDLQGLPAGIGVCADDILAGFYGAACLALLYAAFG